MSKLPLKETRPVNHFFTNACFVEMQQEQPQFYASLAGHLSSDEQGVIQNVMVKADEIQAQQAQALAEQAHLAQQGTGPNGGN